MSKPSVDDILQQGIHGAKEIKPEERKKFLGTLRERVIIALMASQVRESKVYPEIEDACKANLEAHMYLNGNMNYKFLSKYVKMANKYNIKYTLVTNKEYNSELGLVLAHEYAVDKEEIYVSSTPKVTLQNQNTEKKGIFSFFKNRFK
ncbi:YueI family protein [Fredinandcohnia sp. 179-A 10B2 NHS]|uniref:YueI family protein n=1 Tax=Fredinandcohnia sp. 179-A 10B2 NHS TaxID=3235176 RepID=UPI0039A0860A